MSLKDFYTQGKRSILSFDKFKKVYDSFDDYKAAEVFRKSLAIEILQDKLLYHHKIFLRRIGYYALNVEGMDEKDLEMLSHVGENYFTTSITYDWHRVKMTQKHDHNYWKSLAKEFEETYFKFSDNMVLLTIFYGFCTDEKLMFRGKISEKSFLIAMIDIIKYDRIMTQEQLAKRMIKHTNTRKNKDTIIQFLKKH